MYLEDLLGAIDDRDGWREKESGKSVLSAIFDDTYIYIYIYVCVCIYIYIYIYIYMCMYMHFLMGRVFANGPGAMSSIPGRVIPKTLKMVLDTSLLNTQQYKVRMKGKVEQSREGNSALPYTSA